VVCSASSANTVEKTSTPKETARKRQSKKKQELSEKDFESMPVENIDWEKISPEERQQMKDWAKRREAEMSEEICELEYW
jgi:beta-lactam-binding protein with PASTA domain